MHPQPHAPLAPRTTLEVGGPADVLVEAADAATLAEAVALAREEHDGALHLLGHGSNVVVSDEGLRGVTVLLCGGGVEEVTPRDGTTLVRAGGGMRWDDLVAWSVETGLAGIELLSGIPGTVGAAPVQNIGAYGQALDETFVALTALDRDTGELVTLDAEACAFGYRDSRFKRDWRDRFGIVEVTLALRAEPDGPPSYRDLERHFAEHGGDPDDLAARRRAVLAVRRAKSMVWDPADPLSRSAGSFFMSPWLPRPRAVELVDGVRGAGAGERLFAWYSGEEAETVKVPAAMVLLAAGFANGDRWGRVGLSPRHVLALVNHGGAAAQEVADVAAHVVETVRRRLGVELRAEPRFLGAFRPFDPEAFAATTTHLPGEAATPAWARESTR